MGAWWDRSGLQDSLSTKRKFMGEIRGVATRTIKV